jgi:hypothetical protein
MKLAWACAIVFSLVTVLLGQEPIPPSSTQVTTGPDKSQLRDASGVDSDVAKTTSSSSVASNTEQTKRILGFIPNFRSVSADVILPPQTAKDKFKIGLQDTFDYSNFIFVGAQAGLSQATNSYPAFHQGARGYGRYYWHTFADQSDENILVESVLPAAFHEDSRYYTLGHGGFLKRTAYSLSRVLITRTDSGTERFNASEIIGAGGAAGISSAYYPSQYCTWTKTGQRWLTNIILDGANFVVREFWPDVHSAFRHHRD